MARSASVQTAQALNFSLCMKNLHILDEKYTVFGRIITQESYDTLDKIANLETTTKDIPLEVEKAEIKKTEVVTRSSLENILTLDAPERVEGAIIEEVIVRPNKKKKQQPGMVGTETLSTDLVLRLKKGGCFSEE